MDEKVTNLEAVIELARRSREEMGSDPKLIELIDHYTFFGVYEVAGRVKSIASDVGRAAVSLAKRVSNLSASEEITSSGKEFPDNDSLS